MPRLPSFKPREVIRAFERMGYIQDRQRGSHVVMYHPQSHKRAVIPMHTRDIPQGTLKAILKQNQITPDHFLQSVSRTTK